MAKQQNKDLQSILMYAALIGGGYYFVLRPTLIKFGLMEDPAATATQEAAQQNIKQYIDDTISRQTSTKSAGEWSLIANTIYTDLDQPIYNNSDDAVYQLTRVKNDADVAMLIKAFGQRSSHWFGFIAGRLMDLPSFLNLHLTNSNTSIINDNYARKGIKFRF